MEGYFEKITALHNRDSGVGGIGRFDKKPKEIIENKEKLVDMLDNLANVINDNKEDVTKAVGENFVEDLVGSIVISKDILEKTGFLSREHSNGKEILRNMETVFVAYVRKAKEKGSFEKYADVIKDEFFKLKVFFDLVLDCSEFREAEFGSETGYLTKEDNERAGADLRLDMNRYMEKCKEKARARNN